MHYVLNAGLWKEDVSLFFDVGGHTLLDLARPFLSIYGLRNVPNMRLGVAYAHSGVGVARRLFRFNGEDLTRKLLHKIAK